jgi:YhcH/YjgK/YiaL family protein
MIFDAVSNLNKYSCIPNVNKIINAIAQNDFSNDDSGEIEIDDRNLYLLKIRSTIDDEPPKLFEAHRKYADLHIIIDGEELMNQVSSSDAIRMSEYNYDEDYELFSAKENISTFHLNMGKFIFFFPGEIHKSGGFLNQSQDYNKKMVFKIRCDI